MMAEQALLPVEFADLEPFAKVWALPTAEDRMQRRLASSMQEMTVFYETVFARAEELMTYLDRFDLDDLPDTALHLMRLLYAVSTVSQAVDIFQQPKTIDAGSTYIEWVSEPYP